MILLISLNQFSMSLIASSLKYSALVFSTLVFTWTMKLSTVGQLPMLILASVIRSHNKRNLGSEVFSNDQLGRKSSDGGVLLISAIVFKNTHF